MVYIMHGTPRPLECDSFRLGTFAMEKYTVLS